VLLGRDSRLFIVDPALGEVKHWLTIDEISEDSDSLIEGAMFDQVFNTLVFRSSSY